VGITGQKPKDRWQRGCNYKSCYIFYRAIQKYGWNNIEHKILFQNLTKNEACEKEIELITLYDTINRKKGYNILKGGNCSKSGWHHTKESKNKIHKKLIGKISSEETRKKMKLNHANVSGINHPNYGKHLSEETKIKISKSEKGKNGMRGDKNPQYGKFRSESPTSKKVFCDNKIFDCEKDCADYYNLSLSTISSYLTNNKPMSPMFMKLGLRYENNKSFNYNMSKNNKIIVCDNMIFYIRKDCSNYLKIDRSSMNKYLNGKLCMPQKWKDHGLRYYNEETDRDLPIWNEKGDINE
jgi:group I intron endonuclease